MSVINKMLRDLDQRQSGPPGAPSVSAGVAVAPGRAPVGGTPARWWWLAGLALVAVGVGGAALWLQSAPQTSGGAVPPAVPVVAPSAPQSVPALAAASGVASAAVVAQPGASGSEVHQAADTPGTSMEASGAVVLRMESSLSARRALDALLSTPSAPVPPVQAAAVPVSAPPPAPQRGKSRAEVAGAPAAVASHVPSLVGDSTPVLQRQQQAGGDALAQAQGLWASGSRDAAIDLVQQSIAVAERAAKAGGNVGVNPVLLPLVRELARMQLAEGRYGAVWETLTRLEAQLGNQPDLWAIRANAAQRLGRHPDSVHAYMMALQSRPDEQRWLLGAAVSLAALGQTSSAADMADKARAQGPVSKDILAYLRQAGVPFKE